MASYLLLETGDKIVLESGTGFLLLESSAATPGTSQAVGVHNVGGAVVHQFNIHIHLVEQGKTWSVTGQGETVNDE